MDRLAAPQLNRNSYLYNAHKRPPEDSLSLPTGGVSLRKQTWQRVVGRAFLQIRMMYTTLTSIAYTMQLRKAAHAICQGC